MNAGDRLDRSLDRLDRWLGDRLWVWFVLLALAIAFDIAVFLAALHSTH